MNIEEEQFVSTFARNLEDALVEGCDTEPSCALIDFRVSALSNGSGPLDLSMMRVMRCIKSCPYVLDEERLDQISLIAGEKTITELGLEEELDIL